MTDYGRNNRIIIENSNFAKYKKCQKKGEKNGNIKGRKFNKKIWKRRKWSSSSKWCIIYSRQVGSSGSGKSTLLHLIGGVDRPTSGKVYVEGKDIYSLNDDELAIFRRRNIGLIYQFYNLIPILNVEENITLPCDLDGKKVDQNKLNELLKILGLENRRKHLPNELSGGQQQRVSIGRSLINNPSLVLADEPTGNLDSKTSDEIIKLLKESNKKYNQTIIIITHNLEIAKMADRIIKIEDGKLV